VQASENPRERGGDFFLRHVCSCWGGPDLAMRCSGCL
jgi:hypothetical protein